FADELVDSGDLRFPTPQIRKPELAMAKTLVNSLAAEWDATKYNDQYRDNLMRIIKGKVKGKHVELEPTGEKPRADVVDLMERLRQSLEQTNRGKRSSKTAASSHRPRRSSTKKRQHRAA